MTVEPGRIVEAIARRERALHAALGRLTDRDLLAETELPGWSVLTVVCHLRYGAAATLRMIDDTVLGRPTAFYPGGRETVRPATLQPEDGESPAAVVVSLVDVSSQLYRRMAAVTDEQWELAIAEPAGNSDLGSVTLRTLAVLRLTEVEVHGTDLAIGLESWSDDFVAAALPMRLHRLAARPPGARPPGGPGAEAIGGIWRVETTDGVCPGLAVTIRSDGASVSVTADDLPPTGAAIMRGSAHDLLGLLLGRVTLDRLELAGDVDTAARFSDAFPPP